MLAIMADPQDTRPVMFFTGWYWTKERKLSEWITVATRSTAEPSLPQLLEARYREIAIAAGGEPRTYILEGLHETDVNGVPVIQVMNGT